MPIIMMINLKGGVAKTTNAVALSECLANQGNETLLIDADHQCTASEMLIGQDQLLACDYRQRTLYHLLKDMLDDDFLPDAFSRHVYESASNIHALDKLSTIPCSMKIEDFAENQAKAKRGFHSNDEYLRMLTKRRGQFRTWLNSRYDYTVIDCPPSVSMQIRFLIRVAEYFIIPCIPDRLSIRGAKYLMERVDKRGFAIKPLGLLWSLHRRNTVHDKVVDASNELERETIQTLPEPFETVVPNATRVAEATDPNRAYTTFKQKYGQHAKLFELLCFEINNRILNLGGEIPEPAQTQLQAS